MKKRKPEGKPRTAIDGDRVRLLRERLGLSQPALAWQANMHPSDISLIENGRKDLHTARFMGLVVALQTSSDYLLRLSDDPRPARK